MEVAQQVSPVEVADKHSPNLLTLPMVERVIDAGWQVKWKEDTGPSFPQQSAERRLYDLETVGAMSEGASASMEHAYQHVASDIVRSLSAGIERAVKNGQASYASPETEATLTDPVRVQHEAGLQRQDKGPGLAQPIFSVETIEHSHGVLNDITNRIAKDLRDDQGREVFDAMRKMDFAVDGHRDARDSGKPHDERTGEEQRTLAAYNAIATEGMIKAAGGLISKSALLKESELEVVQATITASDRRAEKGSELDVKAPEHVAERRGQIQAAMAAGALQR